MDKNIQSIIKNALLDIDYKECLLFGSQARGDANKDSDYDILIIIHDTISPKDKFKLINAIRNKIAPFMLPVDIIIKSVEEVERQKNLRGSLVRNALSEAVPL